MMNNLKRLAAGMLLACGAVPAVAQYAPAGVEFLQAVKDRNGAKVQELADAQGSTVVNYRDYSGKAALHLVTEGRDLTYMGFLLGKGANPDVQTNSGDTPLILAARIGFIDGANLLLQSNAKVDLANRSGETPLIIAVQQRQAPLVRRLLQAGADPDRQDSASGRSARDYARLDRRNTELLRLIETVEPVRAAAKAGPKL